MPETFFFHNKDQKRSIEEGHEAVRKKVGKELESVRKQIQCTKEEITDYMQESNSGDSADRAGRYMMLLQLKQRRDELIKSEAKLETKLTDLLKECTEVSQKNDFCI
ncbi:hypothetical protein [Legionella israelensis]|uniref:Coiled-coil protein n=1 Tax=Legionella israelensis TaxID=454 RepID=A0A0W0V2H0_9GAMM|nr:hypothetical protein [Legionella israelensis]KTD14327.1 hypothetical protein Lisr_2555 [Legionella israelensis]QBS09755.1 hypothetical protein E4T55_07720 [Legionella israelensis]SCY43212.1 hypothetical protein SAMN02746069_02426 [Legionella israelensis DSM 19235]STX59299.1 Uncharacterised protein [Legionella israelensis]